MHLPFFPALIETDTLHAQLTDPHLRIVDATYFVPPDPRNPIETYQQAHLPGAVFFDIDAIADQSNSLPHMLPTAEQFNQQVGQLGISKQHTVVVYDQHGIMTAPRAWWMFRMFGHPKVSILNGGLPKWQSEGKPIQTEIIHYPSESFNAVFQPQWVITAPELLTSLTQPGKQHLDLRSQSRFLGTEPEPRAGLRSGHIPKSHNLPWAQLLNADKTMLSLSEIELQFQQAGIDPHQPTSLSCGSGITACMGALGLYLLGNQQAQVYDGSWAEWGAHPEWPIAP